DGQIRAREGAGRSEQVETETDQVPQRLMRTKEAGELHGKHCFPAFRGRSEAGAIPHFYGIAGLAATAKLRGGANLRGLVPQPILHRPACVPPRCRIPKYSFPLECICASSRKLALKRVRSTTFCKSWLRRGESRLSFAGSVGR